MTTYFIDPKEHLNFDLFSKLFSSDHSIALSENAKNNIIKCREYLNKKLADQNKPIYGINTGFGALYNQSISTDKLTTLQHNLVKSHACGTGDEVPSSIVRIMMFLKIYSINFPLQYLFPKDISLLDLVYL